MSDWVELVGGLAILIPLSLLLFAPLWHEDWEKDLDRLKAFVRRIRKPRA